MKGFISDQTFYLDNFCFSVFTQSWPYPIHQGLGLFMCAWLGEQFQLPHPPGPHWTFSTSAGLEPRSIDWGSKGLTTKPTLPQGHITKSGYKYTNQFKLIWVLLTLETQYYDLESTKLSSEQLHITRHITNQTKSNQIKPDQIKPV